MGCASDFEGIRSCFPIFESSVYMNFAGMSPGSTFVNGAIRNALDQLARDGHLPSEKAVESKALFAKLIDASEDEVAFVPNTSTGISIVSQGLKYPPGSNVVLCDLEFPSNVYPWLLLRSRGVEVRFVRSRDGLVTTGDFEDAIDDGTRVLAVSHVEYGNGLRFNLKELGELAHEHGAYLSVDATQSAGAIPIDAKRDGVDFLASSCYKWLLGPEGIGYFYVRDDLIGELESPLVGWLSAENPHSLEVHSKRAPAEIEFSRTASRFQAGSADYIGYVGARESLKKLLSIGVERIEARNLDLSDSFIEGLLEAGFHVQSPLERELRSSIVNFTVSGDTQEFVRELRDRDIIVSPRWGGVRVSPHLVNNADDVDRFLEVLSELAKTWATGR